MGIKVLRCLPYGTEIAVVLIPSLVYLYTLCPTVYLGDSGELAAAAFALGIPHNSGYPLYALLGKLFCLLPAGSIGFRMNLMSSLFAVLTVWLVYSLILNISSSKLSAFAGALFLAFVPIFWSQTVSAEVYTLHAFFVALLTRLLWWWDENREFSRLALFVLVTGISFGNHMQTVMLAPAVLFIVLSGHHRQLLNLKHLCLLSVLFSLALSLYLYLPIRTEAGAAIHWGDPNTLDNFIKHVTASAHREGYVFTKRPIEYLLRTKETLLFIFGQFGALLLLALWGWLRMQRMRWQIFFLAVIIFDLVYTIFLNIISFEVTAFTLPTSIVLAILMGIGMADILQKAKEHVLIGKTTHRTLGVAFCMIPMMPLALNFDFCNQSLNYAGYEHTLNIFRTVDNQSTLFLDGDNNIFPVVYARTVERMREDVMLYDRHNIIFKMPYPDDCRVPFHGKWSEFRRIVEKSILENAQYGVYYAVFNPYAVATPDRFGIYPCGILHKAVRDSDLSPVDIGRSVWNRYVTESIYGNFHRDYMNRHLCAHFHISLGKYLFMIDRPLQGLTEIEWASEIGYDDTVIHSDIAVLLTDQGFFEEARSELEKALVYYEDLSGVHNNWGFYFHKLGDYDNAVLAFRKAIELSPDNFGYYNNLGLALYEDGRIDEAMVAFKKSLALNADQPKVEIFLQKHG